MTLVEVEDLEFRYSGSSAAALAGVTLTIEPGEFVVLAGGSGSGKSTLLRAIAGLVPHFHGGSFAGSVRVAGRSSRDRGPGEMAAIVGSLFQDPETQTLLGTPRAELAFPLENRGVAGSVIARAVEETALALAIEGLLDRPTDELSGGELQRVALGATLAVRPGIVCLDEPTSQLDPVAGDELIGLLRRLNDDRDLTVVLAEHRLERCLPYADRVIAMEAGRVSFDGDPERFLGWSLRRSPALATPGATLLAELGLPATTGVRAARARLRAGGFRLATPGAAADAESPSPEGDGSARAPRLLRASRRRGPAAERPAVECVRVWHELRGGPAILRDVSVAIEPGQRLAVMGRNGAGKSTLLRHAAGLMSPSRGSVRTSGRVALVMQNPNDYLVHETVAEEAPVAALSRFGLAGLVQRHPRDLSGGEKQRLALAIVLGAGEAEHDEAERPVAVCLDEPTRGMDRAGKEELAALLRGLDAAVVVATHDPEFAAAFADRVLLLADGRVIADGSASEILSGGTYFATETARILGGEAGVLRAAQGAALLRGRLPEPAGSPAAAVASGATAPSISRTAP